MTDTNTAEREAAEQWLRDRYGAYRGHFAWRELEEAFQAGRASLAASAGSEPVIGWHAFPHYLQHPDGRLLRTASDLLARHGYTGCAEPLRAMSDVLLSTNPSPPEGMAGWKWVPIEPTDAMWNAMMDWGTKKSEWRAILDAAPPLPASAKEL